MGHELRSAVARELGLADALMPLAHRLSPAREHLANVMLTGRKRHEA